MKKHFQYQTSGVCAQLIDFDLEDGKVSGVSFLGGCNGNLKAIAKLCEGKSGEEIVKTLTDENIKPETVIKIPIKTIESTDLIKVKSDEGYLDDDTRVRFDSVIDFPFFLLHVLKVYLSQHPKIEHRNGEPLVYELLDDKKLTTSFERVLDNGFVKGEPITLICQNINYYMDCPSLDTSDYFDWYTRNYLCKLIAFCGPTIFTLAHGFSSDTRAQN